MHELLHTLGFYHMQSAHDRDDYVRINWDNIKDKKEHSFKKYDASIIEHFNITYDIGSIMHYGSKAFTKDRRFDTIVPLVEGDAGLIMGQREGLSVKDILKINAMYKCEMSTIKPRLNGNEESGGCSEWANSRDLCHIHP